MILLGSYASYTTNMLDTIEAFTNETYVQLAATESMCHSTSCGCPTVLCWHQSMNECHAVKI